MLLFLVGGGIALVTVAMKPAASAILLSGVGAASLPSQSQPCRRQHVFREGETFAAIAEQELGDVQKAIEIRTANQQMLDAPNFVLTPDTVLLIPCQQ